MLAAIATAAWLGATLALAASGRLSFTSRPPTAGILIAAAVVLAVAVATSRLGSRLATGIPLAALVGVQAFRFPLEVLLHRAYREGLVPVQMSYSGFNFDILTGLSAIVVALYVARRPDAVVVVRVWNAAGIVLLVNILTIAVLSTPTPIRVFHNEPANEWIAHAPWVWLPSVFVVAAIIGHIVIVPTAAIRVPLVEHVPGSECPRRARRCRKGSDVDATGSAANRDRLERPVGTRGPSRGTSRTRL